MKVQKNSRQIPSNELYTADKKYNDLLYGVLQEMSYKEGECRYVNKQDVNFSALGKRVDLTRQTISTKFKNLISLGLIEYHEGEKRYKLNYIDKTLCSLIPYDTLRAINNTLSQNAISIFVYLLKRYIANEEKPFMVTVGQIKKFIGVATSTSSNNCVVTDIMNILALIGLVDYMTVRIDRDKSSIIIKQVNNTIAKKC